MDIPITVHPLTKHPTAAWEEISKAQTVLQLEIKHDHKSVEDNKVRIVCMSDTHSENENIRFSIPNGDILIVSGDFTRCGEEREVVKFNNWMKSLPHKYKIVICGNHEIGFDKNSEAYGLAYPNQSKRDAKNFKDILTACIYLEDSSVVLHGLKFYGAPWQPKYAGMAFNLPRGEECLAKWNLIPDDTDILITHGPPLGYGDKLPGGKRAGCVELLTTIQKRVKPTYHIFGHIHEGYGWYTDGLTTFINAATCDACYRPVNLPIVFDITAPSKEIEQKTSVKSWIGNLVSTFYKK